MIQFFSLMHNNWYPFVTLAMELCTPSQRSLVSSYYVLPWALGYMLTAVIAYPIRYWRYLQIALTLPAVVLLANFW